MIGQRIIGRIYDGKGHYEFVTRMEHRGDVATRIGEEKRRGEPTITVGFRLENVAPSNEDSNQCKCRFHSHSIYSPLHLSLSA